MSSANKYGRDSNAKRTPLKANRDFFGQKRNKGVFKISTGFVSGSKKGIREFRSGEKNFKVEEPFDLNQTNNTSFHRFDVRSPKNGPEIVGKINSNFSSHVKKTETQFGGQNQRLSGYKSAGGLGLISPEKYVPQEDNGMPNEIRELMGNGQNHPINDFTADDTNLGSSGFDRFGGPALTREPLTQNPSERPSSNRDPYQFNSNRPTAGYHNQFEILDKIDKINSSKKRGHKFRRTAVSYGNLSQNQTERQSTNDPQNGHNYESSRTSTGINTGSIPANFKEGQNDNISAFRKIENLELPESTAASQRGMQAPQKENLAKKVEYLRNLLSHLQRTMSSLDQEMEALKKPYQASMSLPQLADEIRSNKEELEFMNIQYNLLVKENNENKGQLKKHYDNMRRRADKRRGGSLEGCHKELAKNRELKKTLEQINYGFEVKVKERCKKIEGISKGQLDHEVGMLQMRYEGNSDTIKKDIEEYIQFLMKRNNELKGKGGNRFGGFGLNFDFLNNMRRGFMSGK